MENPKNAFLIILTSIVLFAGCKKNSIDKKNREVQAGDSLKSPNLVVSGPTKKQGGASAFPPFSEPPMQKIQTFLYKDSSGDIHLKIPNKRPRHPREDGFYRPDSIYMDSIHLLYRGKNVSVKEAVDVASFRNIQNSDHFFIDKNHVYVNSIYPNAWEPMALERKTAKFFKSDSGYVLNDGITLFSYGEFVRAEVDLSKLRVVKYRNHLKGGNYEFLSDGNIVLRYMYRFGEDDFSDYPGLSEKAKSIIRKKYFPKESINNSDSSGVE